MLGMAPYYLRQTVLWNGIPATEDILKETSLYESRGLYEDFQKTFQSKKVAFSSRLSKDTTLLKMQ